MKETRIIEAALDNLEKTRKITGKWKKTEPKDERDGDLELYLSFKDEWAKHFHIEVKRELRAHHLKELEEMALNNKKFMIVAENIFPTLKQELREKKIAYLDAAGNIFVNVDQFYIWLDGNKYTKPKAGGQNRAFTKTGLKVIFYFLVRPLAVNETYQQIATATEVAIGNIKNILDGLKEAGYLLQLDERGMELINKKALLDRWITGYRETLKPALLIGNYNMWNREKFLHWQKLPKLKHKMFWGGEPAAQEMTNHIRPEILTLYTDDEDYPFTNKWTLIPTEKGDVKIYRTFWNKILQNNADLVPTLLVYADLLIENDPRNLEAAKIIYEKYLRHEFE